MIRSMTAFAARAGQTLEATWTWELRSVNGRGLDLRLRLPDGLPGLEAAVRERLGAAVARGNVTLSLRLETKSGPTRPVVDEAALDAALAALAQVGERARAQGVEVAPPGAAEVLSLRGVAQWTQNAEAEDAGALVAELLADFDVLLAEFRAMGDREGRALEGVLTDLLDRIAAMTEDAAARAEERLPETRAALVAALARVTAEVREVDEGRIAQELALIAVKADVTEEIERLRAHIAAAREIVADDAPSGRRLDFLAQEFNREANTLCSKSGSVALTRVGLDLKAAIDQMREQIQNAE
ncbi:YicC/YloC family endoribonuclease [Wenxinia marina]|uniref:TIGR00255 family protein n=1 Tax=Wenxinia marina DSM 24838 TaxID=1123501 RepID=A0A0D0Q9L7_9RHOB|nr:YicC/YloC family endoribonuclease [Wenxinia marina]KIQ67713.1 hypothetical protein Wenmar_03672 [Wenxinia marina DSM 24838]GGL77731.1 hypothetical protein GCM10011392_35340 [Wenxinia marina]